MDADLAEETVVSKSEFARRINVSAARVSQYISENKISPAAMVGTGRAAKIRLEVACRDLNHVLDISQRIGNGLETQLDLPAKPSAGQESQPGTARHAQQSALPDANSPEAQIKQERLRSLQFQNRKAASEEEAAKGRFMLTSDARNQMTAITAGMLQGFEGSLADFAAALSAKFKIPHRDVLHLLKSEFRKARSKHAEQARKRASDRPDTVETIIEVDA
ncbi:hypothetical protein DYI23_05860 [Roseibium polysiphoniae]|uniref:Uncharacterized protein n=1 Tax=Roseibium polysiphoniae TaxID=2571221 RepID=A0A944CB53_9HYPH|nr:hypothetical protein [Roseibium polysiphoniae]MBS8259739.1 hypothetical protein [Roseibium polysiphoniae]